MSILISKIFQKSYDCINLKKKKVQTLHSYIMCDFFQADTSTTTRLIFGLHITVCLCQLLMFTYSCDCIIRESSSIATAANRGPWPMIPMTTSGRMMKKDLILVIMRSGTPCCLTGRGFFVVSLETYTSVSRTGIYFIIQILFYFKNFVCTMKKQI